MDLRSENPYFLLKDGLLNTYPSLQKNITVDIAIIGAGITGALSAWHLVNAGFNVAILDRRHAGMASTSASTGLLQYEIDTPLHVLIKKIGESAAVRSYELARYAIYRLQEISKELPADCEFEFKPSLQYASFKKHIGKIAEEFSLRKKHGFNVEWLTETDIRKLFGFSAPAGILSADGGQLNPYRFTHGLLTHGQSKGLKVFDNTRVTSIDHLKQTVLLKTSTGCTVNAKKLIMAGGYESQNYLSKKIENWSSTYAIISEPFPDKKIWYRNALIWETAIPYLYLRCTKDNRIIIGGLDDDFSNAPTRDNHLPAKAKLLQEKFCNLFPHIKFKTDFQWAGTFAGTKDGLPYIGAVKERPNTFFVLGYGGNGITFGLVAAEILTSILLGKQNADAGIFSFDR